MNLLRTLFRSLGLKRYLVVGVFNGIPLIYKWFRELANLPDWPAWQLGLLATLLYVLHAVLQRTNELEEKLEPKVSVDGPFCVTNPKNSAGPAFRTYKLRITNTSGELIKNCEVKLKEMVNKFNSNSKEEGRPFKLTLENPPDILNTALSKSFDIKPYDSAEVDIVQYDEPKCGAHVRMCYALQGHKDHDVFINVPVEACPHVMTVRAVADNCQPVDKKYKFYVGEDKLLKLEVA